jgi:hypothetical protein
MTMDMVERYLEAVAAQLPAEEREDIVAELRDLILSRIEAREEELGRALGDDEREAILKEIGHPLVVAARYRKGPDALIGPELFPYWLYGVKAGLLVLIAVSVIGLFIRLITGTPNFGQDISQVFHGFFSSGLTLIGALTVAGAVMEHYGIRPKWLTDWRVRDLSAFQLSDPAQWGAAAAGTDKARRTWMPKVAGKTAPAGEAAFSLLALGLFVLWWVGLVHFPQLSTIRVGGELVTVTAAPIWMTLFAPVLIYALAQMGVDLFTLMNPEAKRVRAVMAMAVAAGGVWLAWTIFQAGHWATLSVGAEQARVAGDWVLLDPQGLRELRGGARDLVGVASTLSLVLTWVLAFSGLSLAWSVLANAWRALRPEFAKTAGQ